MDKEQKRQIEALIENLKGFQAILEEAIEEIPLEARKSRLWQAREKAAASRISLERICDPLLNPHHYAVFTAYIAYQNNLRKAASESADIVDALCEQVMAEKTFAGRILIRQAIRAGRCFEECLRKLAVNTVEV